MRFHLWLFVFFLTSCHSRPAPPAVSAPDKKPSVNYKIAGQKISSGKQLVQTGDLVFRTGNDMTSLFFKQLNLSDKTYSHCGLAIKEGDSVFIYHALGGEFNPDQKIRKESFYRFVDPAENEGFGIYRLRLTPADQQAIVLTADSLYQKGIPFDIHFDLSTDQRMYCAEYIYKSILWGARGRVKIPRTEIKGKTGVATDNLFVNEYAREIQRTRYE